MYIFNKFRNTKGFIAIWELMLRFRYMISEHAKERVRILAFWEKHGDEATKEAFGISHRTLFRWARTLKQQAGKLEGGRSRSSWQNASSRCVPPTRVWAKKKYTPLYKLTDILGAYLPSVA